jgi:hypothetical protein
MHATMLLVSIAVGCRVVSASPYVAVVFSPFDISTSDWTARLRFAEGFALFLLLLSIHDNVFERYPSYRDLADISKMAFS